MTTEYKKDCQFYVSKKECKALSMISCVNCKFYKSKIATNIEEELKNYRLRKMGY